MKQLKYLLLILAFIVSAGVAQAKCKGKECPMHKKGGSCGMMEHEKGDHHGKGCGMGGHKAAGTFILDEAKNLNLTDAQVVKLNQLRIDMKENLAKKEEESDKASEALQSLVHADKPNRKAIEEKTKEIGKLEGETAWIQSQALLDAYAQLTEAQLKKLDKTK